MLGVVCISFELIVFQWILIPGLLGKHQSGRGMQMIETHMTYACAFASTAIENRCPDLKPACPLGSVIQILNESYVKEYALYRNCSTDATMNCSSLCCNGYTLNYSLSYIPEDSQNELYLKCNTQNQCSQPVKFPTNITDHYEYVSVSYKCKEDASFFVTGTISRVLFTRKATVTLSQFSELHQEIPTNTTTSTWKNLIQTRLSLQTKKQTLESASVPMVAVVAPVVIIVVLVGIGVFLIWRKRLLNISYKDHITNEEVRRKIQAAIGEYDELLTLVKKRKLRWFGHVSRSSGLAKTILQGTVKGKRRRGRQKKRWEDNIKEWTGMDFASSTRAAEDRTRRMRRRDATDVNQKPENLNQNATHANNTYDSISLVCIQDIDSSSAIHETKSVYPGDNCGNENTETPSSSSEEAYHKYFKLEPQDLYNTIDPHHCIELTAPYETECKKQRDEYNKIHFAKKTARHDPNYDTMNTILSVCIGDDDGEYCHLRDKETRPSNVMDYSHITIQVKDEAKGKLDEEYSHLQCALNKQIHTVSDVAEYSHLDGK